jgi:hypothetical protein
MKMMQKYKIGNGILGTMIPMILLLVAVGNPIALNAQKQVTAKTILKLSEDFDLAVEKCELEEPCGYFLNEEVINKQSGPWPVVGTYRIARNFWYHAKDSEQDAVYVLGKILVETKRSNRQENEEYLFDEAGKLVHYSFYMGSEGEVAQDIHFFFDGGKLIDYTENVSEEEKEYQRWKKEGVAGVVEDANHMKGIFRQMIKE